MLVSSVRMRSSSLFFFKGLEELNLDLELVGDLDSDGGIERGERGDDWVQRGYW